MIILDALFKLERLITSTQEKTKLVKKFLLTFVIFFLINTNATAESIADQLTTLNNLYKEGAITKEEFSKAKSIILKTDTVKEKPQKKKKTLIKIFQRHLCP